MLGGEALGAFGDEVNVRAIAQDFAGGAHGIAQSFDAADAASAEGGAVHDEGVELDFAVAVEEAAAAGIEGFVVFHHDDRCFDGVEGGAAALQRVPACGCRVADALEVGVDHVIGDGPGAAVNDQGWVSGQAMSPQLPE